MFLGVGGALGETLSKMTFEEARTALKSKGVSEAVLNVIANNPKSWNDFVTTTKTANGKLSKPEDLTNEKSILALITQQPAMVLALATALTPKKGTTPTKEEKESLDAFLKTARVIIAGDGLTTLFNATNRKTTLDLLAALMADPKKPATQNTLLTPEILKAIGALDANGQPTQKLRTALTAMLEPKADGTIPNVAEQKLIMDKYFSVTEMAKKPENAAAIYALAEPQLKAALGAANVEPFKKAFTPAALAELSKIDGTKEEIAAKQAAFFADKKNIMMTKAFVDAIDVDTLPAPIREAAKKLKVMDGKTLEAVTNKGVDLSALQAIFVTKDKDGNDIFDPAFTARRLMNNKNHLVIEKAGLANVMKLVEPFVDDKNRPLFTLHNVQAMLNAEKIMANSAPNLQNLPETNKVLTAFVRYITDDNTVPLKNLKPEEIQHVFQNPDNNGAVRYLAQTLELPAEKQLPVNALKAYWGATPKAGIGAVFADADGAKLLQETLVNPSASSTLVDVFGPDKLLWAKGGVIRDNRQDLINYNKAMTAATAAVGSPPIKGSVVSR